MRGSLQNQLCHFDGCFVTFAEERILSESHEDEPWTNMNFSVWNRKARVSEWLEAMSAGRMRQRM